MSQNSQENLVTIPPIRRLTIRGPPHPPSATSIHSDYQAGYLGPAWPSSRKYAPMPMRQTVADLQRLLNEALADNSNEREVLASGSHKILEPQQIQVSTAKEEHRRCSQVIPSAHDLSASPKSTKGDMISRPQRPSIYQPLLRCYVDQDEKHGKKSRNNNQPLCNTKALTKSAPAPASLSVEDPFTSDNIEAAQAPLEVAKPAPATLAGHEDVAASISESVISNGTEDRLRQPPKVNPRSSSVRRKPTAENCNLLTHQILPTLQLNGCSIPEIGEDSNQDENPALGQFDPSRHFTEMFGLPLGRTNAASTNVARELGNRNIDLKRKSHVDIHNCPEGFNIHESSHHAPVARHWPPLRKRFTSCVACINTTCIGLLLGIYAGEVPAIQYVIADTHHYTILGNVLLYTGLALSNIICWPLPLLHGRKPYIIIPFVIALAAQVPQGLAVSGFRDPNVANYRSLLLVSRAVSGFVLGLSDMNSMATLLDLYGASLQSSNPYREKIEPYDVRRHGGGMGVWLSLWCWCSIGSISIGFMMGAAIINDGASVTWGFWTSLVILLVVLFLNVLAPEVRRSAFRRTIFDVIGIDGSISRITRGEIKMHLNQSGPYWWGEEVLAGFQICWKMIKQPGFSILSVYLSWVYAQYVLVLMLLGALVSRTYHFRPVFVGLCALSPAIGSALALPFQKASLLSRSRVHAPHTDSFTIRKRIQSNSHMIRRLLVTLLLPVSAIGYTFASMGLYIPVVVPCVMAALVGFLSNLASAECFGLILENFDTSDLQPGMTGRPNRRSVAEKFAGERTNFSCYPRVSAGIIITQTLKYVFAAIVTAVGGRIQQNVGTVFATSIVAGILISLTILLVCILTRWKTVQMIPDKSKGVSHDSAPKSTC